MKQTTMIEEEESKTVYRVANSIYMNNSPISPASPASPRAIDTNVTPNEELGDYENNYGV